MLDYSRLSIYKNALKGVEYLSKISSINITNSQTPGYKKLIGQFENNCLDDIRTASFDQYMSNNLRLNITRDDTIGNKQMINGKLVEGSNVDTMDEMRNIAETSNMMRAILTSIQVDNRLQQEILNLGRQ